RSIRLIFLMWSWDLGNNGVFSVKSFYQKLLVRKEHVFPCNAIWTFEVSREEPGEDVTIFFYIAFEYELEEREKEEKTKSLEHGSACASVGCLEGEIGELSKE
ncbi:hypothetical protein HAX54_002192, partial [Datura stramonium]|nr:hypothetical protein [Datura stramonium]